VIPILEAISNNVSALPIATFQSQPGAGRSGPGGFIATLAAAQKLPSASSTEAVSTSSRVGSEAESPSSMNVPMAQIPQSKKSAGGIPVVPLNNVVPASLTNGANLARWLAPQTTLPHSLAVHLPDNNTGITPATTGASGASAPATTSLSELASETVNDTSVPPVITTTSGFFNPAIGAREVSSAFSAAAEPVPSTHTTNAGASVRPDGTQQNGVEQNGVDSGLALAQPNLPTGITPQTPVSFASAQPWSSAISPNATPDMQGNPSQISSVGWRESSPAPQAASTVELTTTPSLPGGSSSVNSGSTVTLQALSDGNPQVVQQDISGASAGEPISQPASPAEMAAALASAQGSAPNILSSVPNSLPTISAPPLGPAAARFAAPKAIAEDSAPKARTTGSVPVATPVSSVATGSNPGDGQALGDQTPFAVFFSGSGAGAESAAGILPKMILPATGSAAHISFGPPTGSPAANPQNGVVDGNAVQSISPQPARGPVTTSQVDSAQAGVSLRHDADPNSANPPTSSLQGSPSPAAPPIASPDSTVPPVAATLIQSLGPQPAIANSSARPDALPAATGSPASFPAPPAQPAALPGPVQVAQMVSRVGQSEMRIGMNTSAFGNVEVRTVVHASDVGLVIGSEKGDLRGLLANELPALTNSLQQQNLKLNTVNFMQGFASSNNTSGGSDSQQRTFIPQPNPALASSGPSEAAAIDLSEAQLSEQFSYAGSSLSILA
jgi:Flagellar hook-length control protein FliK